MTGLHSETDYEFRAVITGSETTARGEPNAFTTDESTDTQCSFGTPCGYGDAGFGGVSTDG